MTTIQNKTKQRSVVSATPGKKPQPQRTHTHTTNKTEHDLKPMTTKQTMPQKQPQYVHVCMCACCCCAVCVCRCVGFFLFSLCADHNQSERATTTTTTTTKKTDKRGPLRVEGTVAPEVKFLDRCKTHCGEGVLHVRVRRSRMRVRGTKMIRHRRSPATVNCASLVSAGKVRW